MRYKEKGRGLGFGEWDCVDDFGGEGGSGSAGRAHYYYMVANFI